MWLLLLLAAIIGLLWIFRNDPDPAYFDPDDLFKKEDNK